MARRKKKKSRPVEVFARRVTRKTLRKVFTSEGQAARVLGISRQSIYQWPEGECIPHLREYQLRSMFPKMNWDAL